MKRTLISLLFIITLFCIPQNFSMAQDGQDKPGRLRPFDNEWKFIKDSTINAETPAFDDSKWRTLDLPHDWSIEDLAGTQTDEQTGPFSKKSPGAGATGYTLGGTGWYRKHFTIDTKDKDKLISILFDGVLVESDVWLNGKHLGYHPYGYTAFAYDITQYLNQSGQTNVLAVRVKNTGLNTRWYNGSGIYRNVSLIVTNPVHIDLWGIHIVTPDVTKEKATVNVIIKLVNNSDKNEDIDISTKLIAKDGVIAGNSDNKGHINARGKSEVTQSITVTRPELWSPDSPNLYKLEVIIKSKGREVDSYVTETGIRSIKYDADNGFRINDQMIELRGGCMHHDNGLLGAAAFERAEQRRIEIMKANGYNAIRCSHNPPSSKFLEACDRLGMLVIDEFVDMWEKSKNPNDYQQFFREYWKEDLESMILRDRNHPSVIIWSIGNEIPEWNKPEGQETARQLIAAIHDMDLSRPITQAINPFFADWSKSGETLKLMDIPGYNYNWDKWDIDHNNFPERLMMGTESFPIDVFPIWSLIGKYNYIIGDFVWTGMDYLGEAGIATRKIDNEKVDFGQKFPGAENGLFRKWPWFNAWCGDIDITGNKKPQSFYRDIVWNRSQMEILVHSPIPEGHKEWVSAWGWPDETKSWNWPGEEGKTLEVAVYTRCNSVRLELNGKFIGEQQVNTDPGKPYPATYMSAIPVKQLAARFEVPYAAGELKAIGIIDGKEVVTQSITTTGTPAKIILVPERPIISADRNDLAYVSVLVADVKGNLIPNASLPVTFEIKGDGELAGAGNSSPDQMTSFRQLKCNTFRGKALIILRPFDKKGKITLNVRSEGLDSANTEITVK